MEETGLLDEFSKQVMIFTYNTMKYFRDEEKQENTNDELEEDYILTFNASKIALGPFIIGLTLALVLFLLEIIYCNAFKIFNFLKMFLNFHKLVLCYF